MDSQRSNTATRLRKLAATIFSVNALDMTPSTSRQEKFRHMIGWTTNEHGRGSYSPLRVEILHKNYNGVYDREKIFLNSSLMAVRVLLDQFNLSSSITFYSCLLLLSVDRLRQSRWWKETLGYALWQRLWKSSMASATLLQVRLPQRQHW